MATQTHHRKPQKFPLQFLLVLIFAGQMAFIAGLVGYVSYRNGRKAVNAVAHELRSEITARIVQHLDAFLDTPQRINEINANALRQGWLPVADAGILERHFWQQVQVFDSVTSIYLGTAEGGLVNAGREGTDGTLYLIGTDDLKAGPFRKYGTDEAGNRTVLLSDLPNFDARTRPWYTHAVEAGDAVWSHPYILFTGQGMAIAASRPVYDDQQRLIGVVSTDVFTEQLSDFLAGLKIGKTGQSFILERSGLLVASSTGELPVTQASGQETPRRLLASDSPVPVVRDTARIVQEQAGGDYHAITEVQSLEFEAAGARMYAQVAPFSDAYGIDWLIVVVIPEADFVDEVKANDLTIVVSELGILIAIGLGIVTARGIAQPVLRLNQATQALARGEWQRTDKISWIVEVDQLTQSFNHMVIRLAQTVDTLTKEIEERMRTEEALRESEERLRRVVETMPVMMDVFDADMTLLAWNRECERVTGYSAEEIVGRPGAMEIFYPDAAYRKRIVDELQAASNEFRDKEYVITCKDGTARIISWSNISARVPVPGWHSWAIGVDVTERVRAEEARESLTVQVHEQARQMEEILATVPEGVLLIDGTGRILQANPVAVDDLAALFDARVGEVLTHLGDLALSDLMDPTAIQGMWHEIKVGKQILEVAARPVESQSEPSSPGAERWVLVLSDVTREWEVREELHQQNRMAALGQLAAGIAHDFNNIMATVVLYTQLMARSKELSAHNRERLSIITQQAWHATRLIGQILDFSRRAMLDRRPLDLGQLMKEQTELLQRTLSGNIAVELVYGPPPYTISADPTRMQQMVMNLAVNARDAMPEGGTLRIEVEHVLSAQGTADMAQAEVKAWVRLRVSDTGMGIAEDVLPHIFEPFFTTKGPGEGSGLGLAQVHGIVGQHGGWVEVTTQMEQGTTFTIYLPALATDQEPLPVHEEIAPLYGHEDVVLVVEDEEAVRTAIATGLQQSNYRVLEATNGREALAVMEAQGKSIAVVLTDVLMPVMGGIALLEALRERGWETPVVFLTGHWMDSRLEALHGRGVSGWLTKPPSLDRLLQVIGETLGERERS